MSEENIIFSEDLPRTEEDNQIEHFLKRLDNETTTKTESKEVD